jgi:hypothetical protein
MSEKRNCTKETTITYDDSYTGESSEITIKTTLHLGRKAISLMIRLLKLLVPYAKLISAEGFDLSTIQKGDFSKLKITESMMNKLIEALLTTLDEQNVIELILEILKQTDVDNVSIVNASAFDIVFQGRIDLLFEVLKFVIIENFTPFFRGKMLGTYLSMATLSTEKK